MAISKQTNRIYEFGPFRLDVREKLLLCDDEAVPLIPKAFDLLLALVENAGRLLEKHELMQRLWPDTFVEDGNLAQNVLLIRKALGESETEKFVETVPRRGYRFIASVRVVADQPNDLLVQRQIPSHIAIQQDEEKKRYEEAGARRETVAIGSPHHSVSVSRFRVLSALALLAAIPAIVFFLSWNKPKPSAPYGVVKSIAVLPFRPLATDSRNEALELGMADTVINKLSGIRQLIVRPLSEVRKYSAVERDSLAAGRDLAVDYVLEGTVQVVGEKVRATWRVIKVTDGSTIRADKCDKQCSDVFQLQDAIAEHIASSLAMQLTDQEKQHLAKHYTDNPEAYQYYILGKHYFREGTATKEGLEKSIDYYRRAIKADTNYAMAYIGLAGTYWFIGSRGFLPSEESGQKVEWASLKALEIDDTLAAGHAVLGGERLNDFDWAGAEKELKRALELDPNSASANQWYFHYLCSVGRADEALHYQIRAMDLETKEHRFEKLALAYFLARQYDKAIEFYRNNLEADPTNPQGHILLGEAYVASGMYKEAVAEMKTGVTLDNSPQRWDRQPMLAYAYAASGKRDEALRILDEQTRVAKHGYISPYNFAIIYTGLGDKDRAFEWLEKGYEQRTPLVYRIKSRPLFDPLRSDPRYRELLQKMNLAP